MPILGTYSSAQWAWYNQIVEDGYVGNCVRLARDNGDPDPANWPRQDIGFSGTGLGATIDVDAFNTFKNGGTVYADTLYGQVNGINFLPVGAMLPFDFYTYPDASVSDLPGLIGDGTAGYISNEDPAFEPDTPYSRYVKTFIDAPATGGAFNYQNLSGNSNGSYVRGTLTYSENSGEFGIYGTSGNLITPLADPSAQELYGDTMNSGTAPKDARVFVGTSLAISGGVSTADAPSLTIGSSGDGTEAVIGFMQGIIFFVGVYHTQTESEDILTQLNTLEALKIPKGQLRDSAGSPVVGAKGRFFTIPAHAASSPDISGIEWVGTEYITDANGEITYDPNLAGNPAIDETKIYGAYFLDYEYVNGAWTKIEGADSGQQNVDLTPPA